MLRLIRKNFTLLYLTNINIQILDFFIGYKNDNIFRPLCIILPQMSGFMKYFGNGGKNMSVMSEDDSVLFKYSTVWNKIKEVKA